MADLDKLIFFTRHPLDKIVQSGTFSISHGGAEASTGSGVANYPDKRYVQETAANTYGRKGFIRAVYSVDGGVNWNDIQSAFRHAPVAELYVDGVYNYDVIFPGLKIQVAIGCDDSFIYARVVGDYFTVGTFRIDVSTATFISTYSGWTSSAQTVMIKYWLFERE